MVKPIPPNHTDGCGQWKTVSASNDVVRLPTPFPVRHNLPDWSKRVQHWVWHIDGAIDAIMGLSRSMTLLVLVIAAALFIIWGFYRCFSIAAQHGSF